MPIIMKTKSNQAVSGQTGTSDAVHSEKPKVKLYNPFEQHFVSQHRADPFANMFEQKAVNDDF